MIKYDNCKNCVSRCEHAGKNREFICMGGKSCKVLYTPDSIVKAAADFVGAIKLIATKPDNLDNLEKRTFEASSLHTLRVFRAKC